jgi:predicted membrane protein
VIDPLVYLLIGLTLLAIFMVAYVIAIMTSEYFQEKKAKLTSNNQTVNEEEKK